MSAALSYEAALHRLLEVTSSPRFGLERMETLLSALEDPHHAFEALHVAGTNGKGSTVAFAHALLARAGINVGRTTSPHLTSACERIVIGGAPISTDAFVDLEARVYAAAATLDDPPTFYERMIAMAFLAFADAKVSLALVEVGLGGRLDATNVVRPRACAISRLSLDHTQFLGDTLEAIAGEKAGILKPFVPAATVSQVPSALDVITARATALSVPLRVSSPYPGRLGLAGDHQRENAGLALDLVRLAGIALIDVDTDLALAEASWPGRLESFVIEGRTIILDGAHNDDAARALGEVVAAHPEWGTVHLVVGATRGHDPAGFAAAFANAIGDASRVAGVTATRARAPRSIPEEEVASGWRQTFPAQVGVRSLDAALNPAEIVRANTVLVTGSLYLVGEIRAQLTPMAVDPVLPNF